jgi:putative ATP-dependent endonuclease of the OLD family
LTPVEEAISASNMLIQRIQIENYRSCKDVDLFPGDIMALVGPNNAGKTNILSALSFVLGDRFPTRQGLALSDFYRQDEERAISIRISFRRNPDRIARVHVYQDGRQGEFKARYWDVHGAREQYLSNDIREKCAIVYLDASRNFDTHFSPSRWSMFGRIARDLHEDLMRNVPTARQAELKRHLEAAQELLKTDKYRDFEDAIADAFLTQVRNTSHQVKLDFRTFDPLNFYKSLQPLLVENGVSKSPSEAGSGMRNLIVMALFRAYAKAFRGDAIFAIEEPEIFLHPHAQRSLATLFEELAAAGNQVFYSTHSATFVNVERSDRIVLVDMSPDDDGELCSRVRVTRDEDLLDARQALHPTREITLESMRERFRNLCGLEHAEAFFARGVLLTEGPSEREAMPIYAKGCGIDFDALGISVVSAGGKTNIDSFYHLYRAHEIPVYVVFDNDRGGRSEDIAPNAMLTRMLGLEESDMPDGAIEDAYAILEGDFEKTIKADLECDRPGLYDCLHSEACTTLGGKSKPLVARYIANQLGERSIVPSTPSKIIQAVKAMIDSEEMSC